MNLSLNEYQMKARKTAIYNKDYKIIYPTLGLTGEAGEVAEKVKKHLRDSTDIEELKKQIILELGDVLWYIANLAADLNLSLETIAIENLIKLNSRKQRNKLHGSGDNR